MIAAALAIAAARYVRIKLFSTLTGITEEAINNYIKRGVWIEGRQYRRKNGNIYIDMKGYEEWVESETV